MEKKDKPIVPEDDDFLDIDLFALHKEWANQPKLYQKYSRIYSTCIRKRDRAEAALKLTKAQLARDIRDNPEKYDLRKVTNEAVEEVYTCHPTYQNAVADVIKAEYNVALLKGTCEALQQRKSALENEVKLHGAEYFAEPIAEDEDDREALNKSDKMSTRRKGLLPKKRG